MPLRTQDRLCYTIASLRTVQKHFASTRMVLLQANEYRDEVCNLLIFVSQILARHTVHTNLIDFAICRVLK